MTSRKKSQDKSDKTGVGAQLYRLRKERRLSIRELAERSGLNVNTLSLIENGKTSPSVSTLQSIAGALEVPITAFFADQTEKRSIVFQKADERSSGAFALGRLMDLGAGFARLSLVPFIVTLDAGADSGVTPMVHTGVEFVYCLAGQLEYQVGQDIYLLDPGDSLLFEAHLPHHWRNREKQQAQALLVLAPSDEHDRPDERHFVAAAVTVRRSAR